MLANVDAMAHDEREKNCENIQDAKLEKLICTLDAIITVIPTDEQKTLWVEVTLDILAN